jgi:4-hydroxybenzoate polyprenyltransferase
MRHAVRRVRWSEIAMGKLAIALVALCVGVAAQGLSLVSALLLLLLFGCLGVFGYSWNDWWDRDADRAAGVPNRLDRVGWPAALALFTASIGISLGIGWYLAPSASALALVVLQLVTSIVYSAPPLRLKERGTAGLVAVVLAQYVLPGIIILAVAHGALLADWLFLCGVALVDGIALELGHQLSDRRHDAVAQVGTFAVTHNAETVRAIYIHAVSALGILFVLCPVYVAFRLGVDPGLASDQLISNVCLAVCAAVALRLGHGALAERRQFGTAWDPYYGANGPATRLLFSYFPNCVLPFGVAVSVTLLRPATWPMIAVVIAVLSSLAFTNTSLSTGLRHYGLRWHLRQIASIIVP